MFIPGMNTPPPLVSVITVCLNSARTIERTIGSVRNQDHPAVEYIVVDGGSTDGTLEILDHHRDRVDRLVSEKDRGISDAFNKGIRLSTGSFLQFLNADDALGPGQLRTAVELLARHPEAGFAHGDVVKVDPRTGQANTMKGEQGYDRYIHYVMKGLNHPTILARRELFERFGQFDERWRVAMDYDWLLRVHQAGVRGVYSADIVATMFGGGISDARAYEAFREVRDISITHGCGRLFAQTYYTIRCLKQRLYVALGKR
jgi:glycosyltransferase involved in cell wall biosynthesis